jgi:hypothetical protein
VWYVPTAGQCGDLGEFARSQVFYMLGKELGLRDIGFCRLVFANGGEFAVLGSQYTGVYPEADAVVVEGAREAEYEIVKHADHYSWHVVFEHEHFFPNRGTPYHQECPCGYQDPAPRQLTE